jgi:hypothetical protein
VAEGRQRADHDGGTAGGGARDPNGGQTTWDTPSVPASAGTVAIEGTPGGAGGIRFTAARDFSVARGSPIVNDTDHDGIVTFERPTSRSPRSTILHGYQ